MIVVQINAECGRGSTGKIALSISKLLNEKGVENYIFYSGNHKSDYAQGIRTAGKFDLRLHQILSRVFGDQGFHSYFATRRMIKRIRKIAPDIILLHNVHGYYLHMGVLFRFLLEYNKPVYWTLHDCWAFTGHCAHFVNAGCDKWMTGCSGCTQLKKYPYSWFFDRSTKLFNKKKQLFTGLDKLYLITPSVWLSELVKQSFLRNYPVTVINNGINLSVFHPTTSDFKERHDITKPMVLGVAAVWSNMKGLDVFIELAQYEDWTIVLVGTDKETDKRLPNNIISIHRTGNQAELAGIYSAADVFVNPTREDTFPTVNIEAVACGTPVVTFNICGCPETVDKRTCIVCKENTTPELVNSIRSIIQNRSERTYNECPNIDERICYQKYLQLFGIQ